MDVDRILEDAKRPKKAIPPWWKRLFVAHHEDWGRIYRCQCGALYTDRAYRNRDFMEQHAGHRIAPAMGGTLWEFIKIKLDLIP